MKFILYGRYDPKTYVAAYAAVDFNGYDFTYVELDCAPVLIAFHDGREIARTYDMIRADDWVGDLAASNHTRKEATS